MQILKKVAFKKNMKRTEYLSVGALSIFLFLVFDNGYFINLIWSLSGTNSLFLNKIAKVVFFSVIFGLSYISVSACLLGRTNFIFGVGVLLFLFGLINKLVFFITGSPLSLSHIMIGVQNIHFTTMFIQMNFKLLLISIMASILFLFILFKIRGKLNSGCRGIAPAMFILIAVVANAFIVQMTYRNAFYAYNLPIVCIKALSMNSIPYVPRDSVTPLTGKIENPDLIVYIIDESVTYEALYSFESIITNTENLTNRLGAPSFLYKAHSAGNLSLTSNYVLRLGLGKSFYPDRECKTFSAPTIFSYAKAAGYKTVFYDAQSEGKRLQNQMSSFDLESIDIFLTSVASVKKSEKDYTCLEELKTIISDASPNNKIMVTIIKMGAHFPYFNRVPQDAIDTIPEPCRFTDTSLVDSGDKSCVMIQYQTVLKYTVDGFLNLLFEIVKEKKFALIYTSDHGQNIYSKCKSPHGSIDNVSECEISVPILLVGDCFYNMHQSDNIKSHFQIPATLISIMGFNHEQYSGSITLMDEWDVDLTYLNIPFGEDSQWQKASYPCDY